MKKLALAAAMALALGGTAKADLFDYAELYGGITQDPSLDFGGPDVDMDLGFNVGGALGWNFDENISADIDFFYTSSAIDFAPVVTDIHVESFSAMANVFYAFNVDMKIKPYVGVGIGMVQVTDSDGTVLGIPTNSDSDIVFGYQAMVGFTTPLDDKIDILVEYRYQGAEDATLNIGGADFSQEYTSHNLSAGFRFHL